MAFALERRSQTRRYKWESDRADRGAGADVHHADAAIGLGEVDLLALDDGSGEGAADGADGGAGSGVDDADGTAFDFDCVGHDFIMPATMRFIHALTRNHVINMDRKTNRRWTQGNAGSEAHADFTPSPDGWESELT